MTTLSNDFQQCRLQDQRRRKRKRRNSSGGCDGRILSILMPMTVVALLLILFMTNYRDASDRQNIRNLVGRVNAFVSVGSHTPRSRVSNTNKKFLQLSLSPSSEQQQQQQQQQLQHNSNNSNNNGNNSNKCRDKDKDSDNNNCTTMAKTMAKMSATT